PVHLSIRLPASFGIRANVSHLRVDDSHGDAYTVWVSQGMPPAPSAAQVAALKQAMDPSVLTPDGSAVVRADGTVSLDFDLPRFGVSLLTLRPVLPTNGEGKEGGGCNSSGVSNDRGAAHLGGRSCRIGVGGIDIAGAAPLGTSFLVLIFMVLRRRGRA
ncbi:MAG TPA: hypothetical protein VG963_33415, partial [Polyangiaceae bacterium]|nr:hypothetical protein [Polyangiaceae bacterium]